MVTTSIVHRAWLMTLRPAARAFERAMRDPETAQRRLLARLLQANRDCSFGRAYGFRAIRSAEQFRNSVPVRGYDDLTPWIERAARGQAGVLTSEPVVMFERTSGSSGAAKLIPYTAALRREFHRALAPWLCDLHDGDRALADGPAYWAVTPVARLPRRTEGGVPVGFDSDAEYFGSVSAWLVGRLLAVPQKVSRCGDIDEALYLTLRHLLKARALTLMSVWNPSLLLVLCDLLETRGDELARDLAASRARGEREQAARLQAMLGAGAVQPLALWPRLRLISCWTSAEARAVLDDVRRRFPGVAIQGKGLLATEGVITIPLARFGGAVPAITGHFLEFVDADTGRTRLVHELEQGREYLPVVTTGGGLWRYRIGDRVRATEVGALPVLEFVGRDDGVCDLRGEKLHPGFVRGVIDELAPAASFAMLAPADDRSGYVLFTDAVRADAARLDCLLRANPHYDYCRQLGQLRAAAVVRVNGDAHARYLRHCERLNRRAGTAKLAALDRGRDWERAFTSPHSRLDT